MPTETEFEQTPDAVAGRAFLEERLQRLSAEQKSAFWDAVGRCFTSAVEDEVPDARAA